MEGLGTKQGEHLTTREKLGPTRALVSIQKKGRFSQFQGENLAVVPFLSIALFSSELGSRLSGLRGRPASSMQSLWSRLAHIGKKTWVTISKLEAAPLPVSAGMILSRPYLANTFPRSPRS